MGKLDLNPEKGSGDKKVRTKLSKARKAAAKSGLPKLESQTELQGHIELVKKQKRKVFSITNVPEETIEAFRNMAEEQNISSRELLSQLLIDAGADILDLKHLNPTRKSMNR